MSHSIDSLSINELFENNLQKELFYILTTLIVYLSILWQYKDMEKTFAPPFTLNLKETFSTVSPESLIWGSVLLILTLFVIYTLLLLYHWLRYGRGIINILFIVGVYFGVSLILISSLLSGAVLLT